MYLNCLNTKINHHSILIKGCIVSFVLLICFIGGRIPAFGQFFSNLPYTQLFLPAFSNPYLNNYPVSSVFNGINPYIVSSYNPFSIFNSINTNRVPFYTQASISGGLIPFSGLYANPLAFPYSAAAYFAAAVTPVDVSGTWAGQWVSSFLAGGIITGELSITLAQSGADVTGTAVFLLNKILKYGAYVVGTVEGNTLTLTSTVVTSITGTMSFDVTFIATVTDVSMEGSYEVINLATGLIAEQGTFTATRL